MDRTIETSFGLPSGALMPIRVPTVSIGLPVYNAEPHLRRALDALLSQDFEDFELIVSDNGSWDETGAICREYAGKDNRVRYVRQEENRGALWNFSYVLEEAKGEFFMWAAHDDVYAPSFISKCLARLRQTPSAVACCSEVLFLDDRGNRIPGQSYVNLDTDGMPVVQRIFELIKLFNWYAIYSLIRRETLLKILPLPAAFGQDVISLLDLLMFGNIVKVREILFYYTIQDQDKNIDTYMSLLGVSDKQKHSKPYSDLLVNLWTRVWTSQLTMKEKSEIFLGIVSIISSKNPSWRWVITQEHPEWGDLDTLSESFSGRLGSMLLAVGGGSLQPMEDENLRKTDVPAISAAVPAGAPLPASEPALAHRTDSPLISIGFPVYNAERHLERALDALCAQDFRAFELILSDNGSVDGTEAICREYARRDPRIRYIRQEENQGSSWNFEFVLREAKAPYFLWAAHDDVYAPRFLSKCLAKLEAHPAAVGCCTELVFLNERGDVKPGMTYLNLDTQGMQPVERILELFRRVGWFATYSLFRREPLLRSLPIPTAYGGDVLHLLEVLLEGEILKVPEPLLSLTIADQEKSPEVYQVMMAGALGEAVSSQPYTGLLRDLWRRAHASTRLDLERKRWLFEQIVRVITFENLDWRGRVLAEQGDTGQSLRTTEDFAQFLGNLLAGDVGARAEVPGPGRIELDPGPVRRALIFFPHNPWPARSGAHARCLSFIRALRALEWEVTLVSSPLFADQPWSEAAREALSQALGIQVLVASPTEADIAWIQRHVDWERAFDLNFHAPPGLATAFRDLQSQLQAQVVFINYAVWAGLIDDPVFANCLRVVDTLDLVTVNRPYWDAVKPKLWERILAPLDPDDPLIADAFREQMGTPRLAQEEVDALWAFDAVIAISSADGAVLSKALGPDRVQTLPMCPLEGGGGAGQGQGALFLASANPFNRQGYLYFISKVMPGLRRECPAFELKVGGALTAHLAPLEGVRNLGWVEDIDAAYASASYAICPLLLGTGQQIKVVEAMAHGLPVILHRSLAAGNPVVDGVNGFIVDDARAFQEACLRLERDPGLCARMGEAARESILREQGLPAFMQGLQTLFAKKGAAPSLRRILWVQMPGVGDPGSAREALGRLREAHPEAEFLVVCESSSSAVFKSMEGILQVLDIQKNAFTDQASVEALLGQVRAWGADLCLNFSYPREPLGDAVTAASGAKRRVGWDAGTGVPKEPDLMRRDHFYTRLIPGHPMGTGDPSGPQAFLRAAGGPPKALPPATAHPPEPRAPVLPRIVIDGVFFQMNNTGIARLWQAILAEWAKEDFGKRIVVLDRAGTLPPLPGIQTVRIPHYRYEAMDLDPFLLEWCCRKAEAGLFVSTYYSTPVGTPSLFLAYDMIPEVTGMNLQEPSWVAKHAAIRHAKSHVAISKSTARDLHRFFPDVPVEGIEVMHLAASPDFQPPAPEEVAALKARLGITRPYFLMVGYRHDYKNGQLFFEALSLLQKPGAFEVVCSGGLPQLEPAFAALIPGVKVHLERLSDADLRAAYGGAVALVYPSRYEGFGLPILEAMACGCPVIACPGSSIPEVGGGAVRYVSDTDPRDLAGALLELSEPGRASELRAMGFERARLFSWARAASELKQALLRACGEERHEKGEKEEGADTLLNAESLQALLDQAHAALRAGDLDRAEAVLVELIGGRPDHVPSYLALAELLERKEDFDTSRQILEAGLDQNPASQDLWQALIVFSATHQPERVAAEAWNALRQLPQGGEGIWHEIVAHVLLEKGEGVQARRILEEGLTHFPAHPELMALREALPEAPLLSVVLPTTMRPERLESFLVALPEALAGLPFEVIGIIPEKDSASREVLARHGGHWLPEETVCPGGFNWSKAMNAGFRAAHGTWAMYASDDIRIEPGALAKALAVGDLSGAGAVAMMESTPADHDAPLWHIRTTQGGRVMVNFGVIRKEAFEGVGGFNEWFEFYAGDWDFCLRLHQKGYLVVPLAEAKVSHDAPKDATKALHVVGFHSAGWMVRAIWVGIPGIEDPVLPARFLVPETLAAQEQALLPPAYRREAAKRGEAWEAARRKWTERVGNLPALEDTPAKPDSPRTTVFCALWHKDPKRWELAKGHQACLDAQTVPVARVYVLDGGDEAPAWLKGKVLRYQEPLGIYEAWARAVEAVETPYVMNLNLDDRLSPEAVAVFEQVLDAGSDLVGGDWQICYSQDETDLVEPCQRSEKVPFFPEWPPVAGRTVRLGSGTGERGTLGPATAWRMGLHQELGPYPSAFADGSAVRVIGDTLWWRRVMHASKRVMRVPVIVGRYHSHPGDQAEFRNPAADEEEKLTRIGLPS